MTSAIAIRRRRLRGRRRKKGEEEDPSVGKCLLESHIRIYSKKRNTFTLKYPT